MKSVFALTKSKIAFALLMSCAMVGCAESEPESDAASNSEAETDLASNDPTSNESQNNGGTSKHAKRHKRKHKRKPKNASRIDSENEIETPIESVTGLWSGEVSCEGGSKQTPGIEQLTLRLDVDTGVVGMPFLRKNHAFGDLRFPISYEFSFKRQTITFSKLNKVSSKWVKETMFLQMSLDKNRDGLKNSLIKSASTFNQLSETPFKVTQLTDENDEVIGMLFTANHTSMCNGKTTIEVRLHDDAKFGLYPARNSSALNDFEEEI